MPAEAPAAPDIFAQIAARGQELRGKDMVAVPPPAVPERILKAQPSATPFRAAPEPRTPQALARLLAAERRRHRLFLRELAPALPALRPRRELAEFQWRQETAEDRADFGRVLAGLGDWTTVRVPHYGPPMGRVTCFYRTVFRGEAAFLAARRTVLRFGAVDYTAQVYLNGRCLGGHEGLFAPFTVDATGVLRAGDNVLVVAVGNDGVCGSDGGDQPSRALGDKIYAATGPGWDEPVTGWHHCPPGMGIWQPVALEGLPAVALGDLFVRPLADLSSAEAWIELDCAYAQKWQGARLRLSCHGRNFRGTVFAGREMPVPATLGPGRNDLRIPIAIPQARTWHPDHPWLYDLHAELLDAEGRVVDTGRTSFGLRTFAIDETSEPRGRLLLNGSEIRLRGANTMGYEQQDVMRGDGQQLEDDLLLGKVCRMNFLRITQRPVQPAVYDACDRLGVMVQTDLPLFGALRRPQFCEGVRQAEEMERLIRPHPSCILVSWINEPFPHAWKPQGHRHLTRAELEEFFSSCARAARLANPDRAIKPIDGDYDPPGPGLPDYHCYTLWYNGHGLPFGDLHAGRWMPVKPGWMVGCGEFGAEGLEDADLARRRWPADWLPRDPADEAAWTPGRVPQAQSGNMQTLFYDRPRTFAGWIAASQEWQARATRLMTEAFRRMERMNTFAIHLFIDAWPTGWMKTIMDCERRPKPAFWEYRAALAPVHAHARCDRLAWSSGEELEAELWLCNDTAGTLAGGRLRWQLEVDGRRIAGGQAPARARACAPACQGRIRVRLPAVARRGAAVLRVACDDDRGRRLHDSALELALHPRAAAAKALKVAALDAAARRLCSQLGLRPAASLAGAGAVVIGDLAAYRARAAEVDAAVRAGAVAVVLPLQPGRHVLGGQEVEVTATTLGRYDFASRATGHRLVEGFHPDDFRFWHDEALGRIAPFVHACLEPAAGWDRVLATGAGVFWGGPGLHDAHAAAERRDGAGAWRVSQAQLVDRVRSNPAARCFALRLLGADV